VFFLGNSGAEAVEAVNGRLGCAGHFLVDLGENPLHGVGEDFQSVLQTLEVFVLIGCRNGCRGALALLDLVALLDQRAEKVLIMVRLPYYPADLRVVVQFGRRLGETGERPGHVTFFRPGVWNR
jgi:hypothetical protein